MNTPSNQAQANHQHQLTLDEADWLTVIGAAGAAPSIHNTQPWRFVLRPEMVELHLDPQRLLPFADPTGREARISCGAALFNLRIALRANGIEPAVALIPLRAHQSLLAIVRPASYRVPSPTELALHGAIPRRRSHRRPFHPAPVPQGSLRSIVYAAGVEGGYLRLAQDPPTVSAIAVLLRRANELQQADPAYQQELARWTFEAGERRDGVPHTASGPRPEDGDLLTMRDFAPGRARPTRQFESDPLFGVLLSAGDTPTDQLRCGQALQNALLTATSHGVGASIMSGPTEVPAARASLRQLVGGSRWPQLVLRFGSAVPTAATPRRPVAELIDPAGPAT